MNQANTKFNPFDHIPRLHALYCRLTGQSIELNRFDRQRQWYELLRIGFTEKDLERVVKYLQREILHGRRNPGALKLSNLLQLDRFEEDLNLSRVKLHSSSSRAATASAPEETPISDETRLQQCEKLREFRLRLQNPGTAPQTSTPDRDSMPKSPRINLE